MFENAIQHHPVPGLLLLGYLFLFFLTLPSLFGKKLPSVAMILFVLAFALNTWIIVDRWVEAGRAPFKTLYETLLFYPWCVSIVTIVLVRLHKLNLLLPFACGINVFGLGYALYKPDVEIVNLPPALQSVWFVPHVVTYFISYAALFASFAIAVVALFKSRNSGEFGKLDEHAHNSAIFGIVTLTFGLVMGAWWGKVAWGDYWSWDPKENWALISWFAYMIYLHMRLMPNRSQKASLWMLIVSFAAVVFTYLGMSLLPTAQGSLHVYQ